MHETPIVKITIILKNHVVDFACKIRKLAGLDVRLSYKKRGNGEKSFWKWGKNT